MLRLLCLGSMAWFYVAELPLLAVPSPATPWRVLRGRPFTWLERFLHAGFQQYVLRRKVSRRATVPWTTPVAASDGASLAIRRVGRAAVGGAESVENVTALASAASAAGHFNTYTS